DATLADAFAEAAWAYPESPAVTCDGTELGYAELDAAANRLARALIARGVRPESRVAVALPRSAELIVALLAVLKAGGCYVPLDTNAPAARLHHILRDSAPVCLLTDRASLRDTALAEAARAAGTTDAAATAEAIPAVHDSAAPNTGVHGDKADATALPVVVLDDPRVAALVAALPG